MPIQNPQAFADNVDKARTQKMSDTAILNEIGSQDPNFAQNVSQARSFYGTPKSEGLYNNDRDLLNYLSQHYSGKMPTVPSVPLSQEEQTAQSSQDKTSQEFQQPQVPSYKQELDAAMKQHEQNMNAIADKYGKQASQGPLGVAKGLAESVLPATSEVIGGLAEPINTGISHLYQKYAPQSLQQGVSQVLNDVGSEIKGGYLGVKRNGQDVTPVVNVPGAKQAVSGIQQLAQQHPELSRQLEAAANIVANVAGMTGEGKAAQKGIETVGSAPEIVGKVAEKAAAPMSGSYLPERAAEFEKAGIKPPVSAVTKSPFLKGVESLSSKGAFGQKVYDTAVNAGKQVEDKINEAVDKMTGLTSVSQENLGKIVQEGIKDYRKNFEQNANKIYDEFEKLTGGTKKLPAITTSTLDTTRKVIAEQGRDLFSGVDKRIKTFLERLSSRGSKQRDINWTQYTQGKKPTGTFSFANLKQTRTAIGEAMDRDPSNTALRRIYGALSEDMDKTVAQHYPEWGQKLDAINSEYHQGMQKIESNIVQSIEQANPENIATNLFKRNSADTLRQLRGMIGEKRYAEIGKSFLKTTFEKAVGKTGKLDVPALRRSLAKYDKETLDEMLNPEQQKLLRDSMNQIEKMEKLRGYLQEGTKISEGSQTAYLRGISALGTEGTGFLTALATGHWGIAAGILSEVAGQKAVAKTLESDIGRRWLTRGLKSTAK